MANTFFISTTGNDDNTGTIDSPFATLQKAQDQVQAGDTIYMRGGRYKLPKDTTTFLSQDGTKDAPIRLFAYEDETPILDASDWIRAKVPYDDATRRVIVQEGDAWHIKGLEMTGGARGFFLAQSVSNSRWENLNVHHNDNSGFDVFGDNTNNNLVLNSDFHHNFDPTNNGQDADGFGFKFGSGTGNVIRNSRLYNNSDDGIDLWEFEDAVTLEGNWSYGNGLDRWNFGSAFEGNGMGFKLGGGSPSVPSAPHILRNNLSWENAQRGFDNNSNAGSIQAYNNTSYGNGANGFYFTDSNHQLRNNVSVGDETVITGDQVDDRFNAWSGTVEVNEDDFQSLDSSIAKGARQGNGDLPESPFLRLAEDSDLIDAGVDVGLPFQGASPDFGAQEGQATPIPVPEPTPEPNKLEGTGGNDTLLGENTDDVIDGYSGDDLIRGREGRDTVVGAKGNDTLFGGDGRDKAYAGEGDDVVYGGKGSDRLAGGEGNDSITGGAGGDKLIGVFTGDDTPGVGEIDTLSGAQDGDMFVLGDASNVYYANDASVEDYAFITDFDLTEGDMLQLKGEASDYSLGAAPQGLPSGTAITYKGSANDEIIAIVQGDSNFELDSSAVQYV